jgi:two-component system sensor histidine kinase DegS
MLFTIGLEAEWCINHLAPDGEARQKMQTIRRLSARSSDELRSAIFALRSRYLPGGEGLVELLQEQVTDFEAQSGIAATLIVPQKFPILPPLVSEAVYRIVRESLSNVRKHARASGVMVSLHCDQDCVTITIQDNGVGLAEPLTLEPDETDLHFGVPTMHQLTAQAQGDFFIANNDDQGVMVKARFPLPGACLA